VQGRRLGTNALDTGVDHWFAARNRAFIDPQTLVGTLVLSYSCQDHTSSVAGQRRKMSLPKEPHAQQSLDLEHDGKRYHRKAQEG